MHELAALRPGPPSWLRGMGLSQIAFGLLIVEHGLAPPEWQLPAVGSLGVLVLGSSAAAVFGACAGAIAPAIQRRRVLSLSLLTLGMVGTTGLVVLVVRAGADVPHAMGYVARALAWLAVPVVSAAWLFVRWSPLEIERPDLAALTSTFE